MNIVNCKLKLINQFSDNFRPLKRPLGEKCLMRLEAEGLVMSALLMPLANWLKGNWAGRPQEDWWICVSQFILHSFEISRSFFFIFWTKLHAIYQCFNQFFSGKCTNPYGKTKYFMEEIIKDVCSANQVVINKKLSHN